MEQVFVVIEQSYCDGIMSWAFEDEGDAKTFVSGRMEYDKQDLIAQGYTPIVTESCVTCEEHRDDIFFEYWIDDTELFRRN